MKKRFLALTLTSLVLVGCGGSKSSKRKRPGKKVDPIVKDQECLISDEATLAAKELERGALIKGISDRSRNLADKIYLASKLMKSFDTDLWKEKCAADPEYRDKMLGTAGAEYFAGLHTLKDNINEIIVEKARKKILKSKDKAHAEAKDETIAPLTISEAQNEKCNDNKLCLSDSNNKVAQLMAVSAAMHMTTATGANLIGLTETPHNYLNAVKEAVQKEVDGAQLTDLEEQILIIGSSETAQTLLDTRVDMLITLALKQIKDGKSISLSDDNTAQALLTSKQDLASLEDGNEFESADEITQQITNKLLDSANELIDFIKARDLKLSINSEIADIINNMKLNDESDNSNYQAMRDNIYELRVVLGGKGDHSIPDDGKDKDKQKKKEEKKKKKEAKKKKRQEKKEARKKKRQEKKEARKKKKQERKDKRQKRKEERRAKRNASDAEKLQAKKDKLNKQVAKKNIKTLGKKGNVGGVSKTKNVTYKIETIDGKTRFYLTINGKTKKYKNRKKFQRKLSKALGQEINVQKIGSTTKVKKRKLKKVKCNK